MCSTFTRSPLALGTRDDASAGLGFENQSLGLSGKTAGNGQKLESRWLQMYWPSRPLTSARAKIWVQMAPNVVASKSSLQSYSSSYPELTQYLTRAAGTFSGASWAARLAAERAAVHLLQLEAYLSLETMFPISFKTLEMNLFC